MVDGRMYEVMIGGTVHGTYANKYDAEIRLAELKHSFLALVHRKDTFWIRER